MTFADLPAGASVFVDANTLTYYFQPHPTLGPVCEQLVRSIEHGHLLGFTSTAVLGEVAHRMMTVEANRLLGWPFQGIGNRLRTHPDEVRKLSAFRLAVEQVLNSKLQVLPVTPTILAAGLAVCQQVGLLTNDGVLVAVMQANGLANIASNDADFDRVSGLMRYAPA